MSNVDHAEIAKFEALAHRWWDRESEFKPLHEINPLRVNWIDEHISLAGKKVIDIGCGGGILSEAMAQRGAQVTGIDMGEAPLSVARLHLLESGLEIDYRQITAEAMAAEAPEQFDVVTCLEMLEHVPDPASVIRPAPHWSNRAARCSSPPSTATRKPTRSPSSARVCVAAASARHT